MTTHVLHPDQLQPGHMVGAWRIVANVGTGGTSRVFKVEREGQIFALKMALRPFLEHPLRGDEESCWRMTREVAALLTYSPHPNLLRVYAVDCWPHPAQGYLFFVTDYVEGDDWHGWRWRAPPDASRLVETFSGVVRTLSVLHSRGVLHRDLKADNILIRRDDGRPVLIDFGNVKLPGAFTLTLGLPPGVMHLLPPEVLAYARGESWKQGVPFQGGVAADLYALGVLFYQGLTDLNPFDPKLPDEALLAAIATVPPTPPHVLNPRVPPTLSAIALKLLEKRAEDRYPDTDALLQALEKASAERDSDAWQVPLHDVEKPSSSPAPAAPEEPRPEAPEVPSPPQDTPAPSRRAWRRAWPLLACLGVVGLVLWLTHSTLVPPEKGIPSMSPSPPVQDSVPPSRSGVLIASLCALTGLGCPSVQLKPPGPSDCPTEALQAMSGPLKLPRGSIIFMVLDPQQDPDVPDWGRFHDGPLVSLVTKSLLGPSLPEGTLLYGYLWTGPGVYQLLPDGRKLDAVMARWTSAVLPNGRRYPVCIAMGDDGREPKEAGMIGDDTLLARDTVATVVTRWP